MYHLVLQLEVRNNSTTTKVHIYDRKDLKGRINLIDLGTNGKLMLKDFMNRM